jgi:hypothetical protein
MERSYLETYLESRIGEFAEKLELINSCRLKELGKPLDKRSSKVLYLLHRDETLYYYCMTEFIRIKNLLQ